MPALTPVVDKLEDVPEPARQFYVQKEGKFHVDLSAPPSGYVNSADLATANGKIIEFRDNNILLKKQVDELSPLKTKFEGIDPDAARAALTAQEELKKKGVTKPDDITKQISEAVLAAVKPLQDAANLQAQALKDAQKRADDSVLRSKIGEKFIKAGGKAQALDYIISQSTGVFQVENGEVKAAPNKFSTANPGNPLDLDEWIVSLTKDHGFAFEPSKGGGASGSGSAAGAGSTGRAGQTILKDPTPSQLGEFAKDISTGKMRVEYTNP